MTRSSWRRAGDLAVTGTFAVLTVVGALAGVREGGDPARAAGSAAAELLSIAVLMMRRRYPLPVLAAVTVFGVVAAMTADRTVIGPLLPAFALYTLAAVSSWRVTAVAATAVVAAYGAGALIGQGLAGFVAAAVILAIAAAIGLYVGEHRTASLRSGPRPSRTLLLAGQAVLAERVWIARELHDAIGHHVSLLVVQAGAVRTTLPDDHPARAVLTA